jgi:hypothetical protein
MPARAVEFFAAVEVQMRKSQLKASITRDIAGCCRFFTFIQCG